MPGSVFKAAFYEKIDIARDDKQEEVESRMNLVQKLLSHKNPSMDLQKHFLLAITMYPDQEIRDEAKIVSEPSLEELFLLLQGIDQDQKTKLTAALHFLLETIPLETIRLCSLEWNTLQGSHSNYFLSMQKGANQT